MKKTKIRNTITALCMATALSAMPMTTAVADDNDRQGGDGRDISELAFMWWQHTMSIPSSVNPLTDETGQFCSVAQRGDVWFLHGSTGNTLGDPIVRHCTVPAGKQIFLPFINWLCVPFPNETVQQNVGFCKEANDLTDLLSLTIDGNSRDRLIARMAQKKAFDLTVPVDNVFGWPSGTFTAVHDGYFALLPKLSLGEHEIHIQGGVSGWDFYVDVIYHIDVVKPGPMPE